MKKVLYLDFETRSELDLATCGTYRYAQHASTQMLLIAYAFDDEQVRVSRELPDEVFAAIQSPEVLKIAHNAEFDHRSRSSYWAVRRSSICGMIRPTRRRISAGPVS